MITNCPNCGAPLKNGKCEYCGTEIRIGVTVSEVSKYLNGGYKSEEKEIKDLIERIEKDIEKGIIDKFNGLRQIAGLRAKLIDLKEKKTLKV